MILNSVKEPGVVRRDFSPGLPFRILPLLLLMTLTGCSADTGEKRGEDTAIRSDHSIMEGHPENREVMEGSRVDTIDSTSVTVPAGSAEVSGQVRLSQTEYIVEDTATAASLRLYVLNDSDVLSVIDRVDPSCGCIMTTVQRRNAHPGDSAEIYIGFLPQEMSRTQPYTVDVYMTTDPSRPLRLTIWKREAYESGDD